MPYLALYVPQQQHLRPTDQPTSTPSYPDILLWCETVGLVLVLLYFAGDLGHLAPLAEVDQPLLVALQEVWVALLRLQDVGQVHPCTGDTNNVIY